MRQVKTKTNTNTSTNSKNNLLQFMWFVHFAQIRVSELKILSLFLIKQRWFFFFWGKTLSSHVPVILHPYLHYSVACYCSYSEASQWLVCFSWVEKNKSKNGQLYIAGLTAVTGFNKFYYVCVCVCVHLLTPACCNFTLFHCWGL